MNTWSRRQVLLGGGGALVLAACSSSGSSSSSGSVAGDTLVGSSDPAVERRDALRRKAGAGTVTATIDAAPVTVSIGGKEVDTWSFGARPGDGVIRANAGDLLRVKFTNNLAAANTIHWHGIALRNDMDGVHDLTMMSVPAGGVFDYAFTAPDPGTYWFHPHMGLELDKGLYAPLIIEDPNEPLAYDVDVAVMLDDWLDGYGRSADDVLAELQASGGHSGHQMGNMGNMNMGGMSMGGLNGDVSYPLHLINGRAPTEIETFQAKPGQRVRFRLINAGSDTPYRVAIGGHSMTVTHADGFPVQPVEVDNVVLGMGERYDVIVTVDDGAFPIVASAEGKSDPHAAAILRTSASAAAPDTSKHLDELDGRALEYADLVAADGAGLAPRKPDRTTEISLTASDGYVHGIDGKAFPKSAPITIAEGERLRLKISNNTMMFHPIHLHGHSFQMVGDGNARKDTVNVLPMTTVSIDIEGDNPGQWMLHCHNTYHLEMGMATTLSYRR
jgi:FtsP/CotA-like multicopper oxidase with cupredoxin domain